MAPASAGACSSPDGATGRWPVPAPPAAWRVASSPASMSLCATTSPPPHQHQPYEPLSAPEPATNCGTRHIKRHAVTRFGYSGPGGRAKRVQVPRAGEVAGALLERTNDLLL